MELVLRDTDESIVGVVHPTTAEVLDLETATREQIAEWFLALIAWQRSAGQAVIMAERAFVQKTDRETSLGVNVEGYRVSVPGAQDRFVPDHNALRKGLLELVAAGTLSQAAADDACRPTGVTCPSCETFIPDGSYKISHKALNALRKVKAVEAVIDASGEYHAPARHFSVKKT